MTDDSPYEGLDTYTWVRRTVHELMTSLFMDGHDGGTYSIVMHPGTYLVMLRQAQWALSYTERPEDDGKRLFGMTLILDQNIDADYIGLRHEVGNQ